MIALQVYTALLERLLMSGKRCRAETGEADEIADQVRLVVESTVQGQSTPVRRRGAAYQPENLMKPMHTMEQFRCKTDLGLEDLDEPTLAQTDSVRKARGGLSEWSGRMCRARSVPRRGASPHQSGARGAPSR